MIEKVEKDLENLSNAIHILCSKRSKLKRAIINLQFLYQQDFKKEQEEYKEISEQINKLKKIRYRQKKIIQNIKEYANYAK